jgi:DNA-binding XRE family transcriptional regulator
MQLTARCCLSQSSGSGKKPFNNIATSQQTDLKYGNIPSHLSHDLLHYPGAFPATFCRSHLMTPQQYKAARKHLGLTQAKLADILGVTRKTICSREAGSAPITAESVIAINCLTKQQQS